MSNCGLLKIKNNIYFNIKFTNNLVQMETRIKQNKLLGYL